MAKPPPPPKAPARGARKAGRPTSVKPRQTKTKPRIAAASSPPPPAEAPQSGRPGADQAALIETLSIKAA